MPITPLFTALFALMFIFLSIAVVRIRFGDKVSLGHADNKELETAVRIHANFIEYVPISLILFWFIERITFNSQLVLILGCALLLARVAHVIGMRNTKKYLILRKLGVMITFLILLLSSLYLIWWYLPISV